MRLRLLARSRVLCVCAALAIYAGLTSGASGCGASAGSSVTVSGKTLTVYVSAPPDAGQAANDVLLAEQLAFNQQKSSVTAFQLSLRTVHGKKISDNARTAIQDKQAIAYLGEVVPGLTSQSLGITNAQDLLAVSPTDTELALTQHSPAVPGSPEIYYESLKTYGRTFGRVVATTGAEARAQAAEMQALHVSKLYVAQDGSQYGKETALEVRADAAKAGISVLGTATGADAVFYGGSSFSAAARLFDSAVQSNPSVKLFAPSALDDEGFVTQLSPAAQRALRVSAPGFRSKDLNSAAQSFAAQFRSQYGHAPATEAVFGYEAMSAVLYAIHQAGTAANNRATVVHDFFSIKNRSSALGTYSMNAAGDTTIAPFVFSRVQAGKLVPYKAVSEQP